MTSEQRMLRAIARGASNPQGLAQYALDHPSTSTDDYSFSMWMGLRNDLILMCVEKQQEISRIAEELRITLEDDPVLEFIDEIRTKLKGYL